MRISGLSDNHFHTPQFVLPTAFAHFEAEKDKVQRKKNKVRCKKNRSDVV